MTVKQKIVLAVMVLLMGAAMLFPAAYAVFASDAPSDGLTWETVSAGEAAEARDEDEVGGRGTDGEGEEDGGADEIGDADGDGSEREAAYRGDSAVHFSNPEAGMRIALTFDDGPHPRYTPEILDFLAENGIRATFFVVGQNAEAYPELVKRELGEGHEVGNHTFSHAYLSKVPYREQCDEVIAAENAVFEETGYRTHLLRPPGGLYSEAIFKLADRLDYSLIMWSVDTRDWAHTPVKEIVTNVLGSVKGGDVILFHDFIAKTPPTLDALREIVPELKARGYEFVTVSEMFGLGG